MITLKQSLAVFQPQAIFKKFSEALYHLSDDSLGSSRLHGFTEQLFQWSLSALSVISIYNQA